MTKPLIVRIRDNDDAAYDEFVIAPPGMTPEQASEAVSAMILKVREADPEEHLWADLEALLVPAGFITPDVVKTEERW